MALLNSMNTAFSAMDGFKKGFDVVSNNISNVNSIAFKGSRMKFLPNFSTTIILYYVECVLTDSAVKLKFPEIARKFAFGCLYSGLVFMMVQALYGSMPLFTYISLWRLSGFAGDPNYYSLYLCLSVAMIFIIAEKHKVRDYFYLFAMIALALLTSSKMSLVTLMVILLYFLVRSLYGIFSRNNRFARRIVLIGAALTVIFTRSTKLLMIPTSVSHGMQRRRNTPAA